MVNDDAKLQAALSPANAGVHEVKDYVDELELLKLLLWPEEIIAPEWTIDPLSLTGQPGQVSPDDIQGTLIKPPPQDAGAVLFVILTREIP